VKKHAAATAAKPEGTHVVFMNELSHLQVQYYISRYRDVGDGRSGVNDTTYGDKVAQQSPKMGLRRPTFQSLDTAGDIAISWTLGKMVLEARKKVPLGSALDQPSLDDIPIGTDSPIKPIHPPFLLQFYRRQHIAPLAILVQVFTWVFPGRFPILWCNRDHPSILP
jgi:hypothetical protein